MNLFTFFFLTTAMVTAAPRTISTTDQSQHKNGKPANFTNHKCNQKPEALLKYITAAVKMLKKNLTNTILEKEIQNVFMDAECNRETLCKAGKILSAYKSADLNLTHEKDWRLPRMLQAYSKNCTNTGTLDSIPLHQLLNKIQNCSQKAFAKPCEY